MRRYLRFSSFAERVLRICVFCCLILLSSNLNAVGKIWIKKAIEGCEKKVLVINPQDPSVPYAGTSGGVYKSTDGFSFACASTPHAECKGVFSTKLKC